MPTVRADIVDVYVFRRWPQEAMDPGAPDVELLQLFRTDAPMLGTWQPVMGHVEGGETAAACAVREIGEEIGLEPGPSLLGLWALEQVHPYYIHELDTVVMSPRFAAEVPAAWRPRLNAEHSALRWVPAHQAERFFMWPGQVAAAREITGWLLRPGSAGAAAVRVR